MRTTSMRTTSLALVCAALAVSSPLALAGHGVTANSPNLPPLGSSYVGQFHSWGGGMFTLTNPVHSGFTMNQPPPPPGGSQLHTFMSEVSGVFMGPGITAPVMVPNVPVSVQVVSRPDLDTGDTRFFDTEMLQLDINGGGLMIRESPTRPSTGQTSVTSLGGGIYQINSFFDVFTELSLDGGQSWIPSDGSLRMDLHPTPAAAGLLALGGLVAARRRRN